MNKRNNLDTNYRLHLPWHSLVWAIPVGAVVEKNGVKYRVTSVGNRVPVPGIKPTITLEKIETSVN